MRQEFRDVAVLMTIKTKGSTPITMADRYYARVAGNALRKPFMNKLCFLSLVIGLVSQSAWAENATTGVGAASTRMPSSPI
jgi:hypothetical protein